MTGQKKVEGFSAFPTRTKGGADLTVQPSPYRPCLLVAKSGIGPWSLRGALRQSNLDFAVLKRTLPLKKDS